MAELIGGFFAIMLITLAVRRVLRPTADTATSVTALHVVALALATVLGGYGFGTLAAPRFGYACALYLLPTLASLALQLLAMIGRHHDRAARRRVADRFDLSATLPD